MALLNSVCFLVICVLVILKGQCCCSLSLSEFYNDSFVVLPRNRPLGSSVLLPADNVTLNHHRTLNRHTFYLQTSQVIDNFSIIAALFVPRGLSLLPRGEIFTYLKGDGKLPTSASVAMFPVSRSSGKFRYLRTVGVFLAGKRRLYKAQPRIELPSGSRVVCETRACYLKNYKRYKRCEARNKVSSVLQRSLRPLRNLFNSCSSFANRTQDTTTSGLGLFSIETPPNDSGSLACKAREPVLLGGTIDPTFSYQMVSYALLDSSKSKIWWTHFTHPAQGFKFLQWERAELLDFALAKQAKHYTEKCEICFNGWNFTRTTGSANSLPATVHEENYLRLAPVQLTCGHIMHHSCLKKLCVSRLPDTVSCPFCRKPLLRAIDSHYSARELYSRSSRERRGVS